MLISLLLPTFFANHISGSYIDYKPDILSGICATSPELPCCKKTLETFNNYGGMADTDYPSCRDDGYYEQQQCGYDRCHCVDKFGKTITCPAYKPEILSGICSSSPELPCCKDTLEIYNKDGGDADKNYPDCRDDGYYKHQQCEIQGCYCVDKFGKKITCPGHYDKPNILNGICVTSPELPCCKDTLELYNKVIDGLYDDVKHWKYPLCRADGYYVQSQCKYKNGVQECYCVDGFGENITCPWDEDEDEQVEEYSYEDEEHAEYEDERVEEYVD